MPDAAGMHECPPARAQALFTRMSLHADAPNNRVSRWKRAYTPACLSFVTVLGAWACMRAESSVSRIDALRETDTLARHRTGGTTDAEERHNDMNHSINPQLSE